MSVFEERREELEKHEFMMGVPRGRLAVTLDVLTDALVLVGQHGRLRTRGCEPQSRHDQPGTFRSGGYERDKLVGRGSENRGQLYEFDLRSGFWFRGD